MLQRALATTSHENADKALKQVFETDFNWIEIKSTSFSYDPAAREAKFVMDGAAAMSWASQAKGTPLRYETDFTAMGSNDDFKRKTPGYDDLPYTTDFPNYVKATEVIQLPRDGAGFSLAGADVDKSAAGAEYRRKAKLEKGVVTIEASTRMIAPEVPAAQIEADKTVLRSMAGDPLFVLGAAYWRDKDAEIAVRTSRTPVTASEFANRGDAWLSKGEYVKAIADFDEAVKLKPETGAFQNARCFARAQAGRELEAAMADCEAALKIRPKDAAVLDSRALVWFRMGKFDEALKDYNAALALSPDLASSLFMRGVVEIRQGHASEGQTDIKAAMDLDPNVGDDYVKYGVKP